MKKYFAFILLSVIAFTGFGQDKLDYDWGLKGGLNNSKITTNRDQFSSETINNFHFGAFVRLNLGRLYIQPEAYLISKGGDIKAIASYNPLQTISSFNYNSFDLPILVGVKVVDLKAFNLRVLAGPAFSFLTKKSIDNDMSTFSVEHFKNSLFAWQYGVGVDVLFLTFDARIERSTGDIYSGTEMSGKNNTLLLSLGIKF